ncbi:TPA: DNA cytosine methyltransferase [Streptococcus pneumoniae]
MKIDELNVLELFGGIGAIRKALIRQKIPHKTVDYVEIDKNCVKSYNALYDEEFEPKSIVDYHPPDEKIDLLMHGSPCQDFSRSGLKKGGTKGSGTRSSLLFETIRIIEEMSIKPKVVLWENVKGVLDRNLRASFFHYLKEMERLGYENKYEILNAMDFGIPQKRERIFVVSILGNNPFDFVKLEKTQASDISEFIEKDVSNLYEVRQESMLRYIRGNPKNNKFRGRLKVIDKFAYTISTKQVRIPNSGIIDLSNGKYRYLTERECFRLMGFDNEDFNKLKAIYPGRKGKLSSILYKQAGNSIVVNVLEAILKEILEEIKNKKT